MIGGSYFIVDEKTGMSMVTHADKLKRKEIVENSALASTTLFVALGFPSGK